MSALIDEMARAICASTMLSWSNHADYFRVQAKAALAVVRAHYGDPANISDRAVLAADAAVTKRGAEILDGKPFYYATTEQAMEMKKIAIAATMKADAHE